MNKLIKLGIPLILITVFQNFSGFNSNMEEVSLSSTNDDPAYTPINNPNNPLNGGTTTCTTTGPGGKTLLQRLSRDELNNSLKDILGITTDFTINIPGDDISVDGFSNNAGNLSYSTDYFEAVSKAVELAIISAQTSNANLFKCATGITDAACSQTLIQALGRKAYRRSLTTIERDKIVNAVKASQARGFAFKDAMASAYQRLLLSPKFIFRTSFGKAGAVKAVVELSPHEYVTRLAYFLWNGPPDEILISLADQNKLTNSAELRIQIARMLKDPKALRFNESFIGQWVGTRGLVVSGGVARPGLTAQLQTEIKNETELFGANIIQNNKSALDFISAKYTFLTENLANFYGIPGVTGSQFRQVALQGVPRQGLMTHASFLILASAFDRSSPVARGNLILSNFLCTPPPPFPDGLVVTPLDGNGADTLTLRERLRVHSANPACAGCHTHMDPIGLAFENFDQLGKYRPAYETGRTIDASGNIYGKSFSTHKELLDIFGQQNEFKRCITRKLLTYAVGRTLNTADRCAVNTIGEYAVQADKTFLDLVSSIVVSDQFRFNKTDSWGL